MFKYYEVEGKDYNLLHTYIMNNTTTYLFMLHVYCATLQNTAGLGVRYLQNTSVQVSGFMLFVLQYARYHYKTHK